MAGAGSAGSAGKGTNLDDKLLKMTSGLASILKGSTKATPLTPVKAKTATSSKSTASKASSASSSSVASQPPTYTAPVYDEKKYRSGIDTSFYDQAINNYNAQAEKQRAIQLGEAKKTQENALKQAYIQRVQNQNALEDSLARSGIRGGATETANLRLQNQYGTAVGAANTDYSNSVNSINQAIDKNIFDYTNDMNSRAEQYRQDLAQARWTAARQDSLNEYNSKNEYWNNYYLDKYSGYSAKALKKAEADVKKKLKSAKTQAAKIRWQQALRGIGNRKGVLANSK